MSESVDKDVLLLKVAAMFRPSEYDHLEHKAADVICGPNDAALIGYDTYFSKAELVEDFGFTREEADAFVTIVHSMDALRSHS